MNLHPVVKALVFVELSRSDAHWLLREIDDVVKAKETREIALNVHDLVLDGVQGEIVIEDILDCSDDGRCRMSFDQFKSLLMGKMDERPGASESA